MTAASSDHVEHEHGSAAESLRAALGWDKFPEMTPQQRDAYEAANQQARTEARRFYGEAAA